MCPPSQRLRTATNPAGIGPGVQVASTALAGATTANHTPRAAANRRQAPSAGRNTFRRPRTVQAANAVATMQATSTGAPILGQPPGVVANCGSPCLAATWPNPFRTGTFSPGYSRSVNGVSYRPLLVTMIHGRSAEEAAKLIASATTADALGGARGTFMFMDGADPARGREDVRRPAAADLPRVRAAATAMLGPKPRGHSKEGRSYPLQAEPPPSAPLDPPFRTPFAGPTVTQDAEMPE